MATTRVLSESWQLDDCILGALPLSRAMGVYDALLEHGYLRGVDTGLGPMYAEWVQKRTWRYRGCFDMPHEDERAFLEFTRMAGSGDIYVNDQHISRFESGSVLIDITGALCLGKNELEAVFLPRPAILPITPDGQGTPLEPLGIIGPVRLNTANYVTLAGLSIDARESGGIGRAIIKSLLTAHVAGKYAFKYVLSDDGGIVADYEFIERLPAAEREVTHALELQGARAWAPSACFLYDWKLSIERSGIGCETLRGKLAFIENQGPDRVARLRSPSFGRDDAVIADMLAALGARAVMLSGARAQRVNTGLFAGILPVSHDAGDSAAISHIGTPRGEKMRALAGDAAHWPPGKPAWKLRGSADLDLDAYESLFGPGIRADAGRFARVARALQAERTASDARRARAEKRSALIKTAVEPFPHFASPALIEADGSPRPAYWALCGAWQTVHVCALLPELAAYRAGELVSLPIWAFAGAAGGARPVTVNVTAYALNGAALQGVSLPIMLRNDVLAGGIDLRMPPGDDVVIVRSELISPDGALIDRSDSLLTSYAGQYPLAALLDPVKADIVFDGDCVKNQGAAAAIGFCAGRAANAFCGYGALLPGDSIRLPGFKAENIEALNNRQV